jgi:L,D-peptidoglycan transpeptidase YkuD (ErfK/YbiS/YcfS/YnhG family)
MQHRLVPVVAVVLLLAVPAPAHADEVTLDGVHARVGADTGQVVTVNRTSGFHARVTWWTRSDSGWVQRMQASDGRIGYGGLVRAARRRQGTGTTPLGTFRLPWAFGAHAPSDAWSLRYRQVRKGDYWVQDNASAYYNRYRNKSQGGFRWRLPSSNVNSSERLRDYPRQYEFAIVTSFNHAQVRHRGSGIFLHVNGSGATGGCVSAPRRFIARLMRRIDPAERPVIAIGR